ncbi:MAG TPA: L-histidine N(alpha)-methyltransferase [Candidatus Eisenbacteria bacterium]
MTPALVEQANRREAARLKLIDLHPAGDGFLADVLLGLSRRSPEIPCKYFYDAAGSVLFDRICELPEYYPTRTELGIMHRHAAAMATRIGPGAVLIEYGSGSSLKTRTLLAALESPGAYVPVDIAKEHLLDAAARLSVDFPRLDILPIAADFTRPFQLPDDVARRGRRVVYFPGSTIGNFTPDEAVALMAGMARLAGPDGRLLLGVDRVKPRAILEAAYNDAAGVTAAFNLNLLTRMNRELGADFDPTRWSHRAFYNEEAARIEMHLESRVLQAVRVGGATFLFEAGDSIRTEYSHKYDRARIDAMAERAGWEVRRSWSDAQEWFSVLELVARRG